MMKKKLLKTVIATVMALTMTFSLSNGMVVMAAETDSNGAEVSAIQYEYVDDIDAIEVKELAEVDIGNLSDENVTSNIMEGGVASNFTLESDKAQAMLGTSRAAMETQTYYGTIVEENGLAYIQMSLEPGEILNTNLICPQNEALNYDLYLYECNVEDGSMGELLDASVLRTNYNTYSDGSEKTVDEAISYINIGSETAHYYVIVFAEEGYSETDLFYLSLSIAENGDYDAGEPNDSPYSTVSISTGTVSNLNLHADNDQDWFTWSAVADFPTVSIATNVIGYDVEVYTTDGYSMYLVMPTQDNVYTVTAGTTYFIRVFANSSEFASSSYTLSVLPDSYAPAHIYISGFSSDMGSNKVTYNNGSLYRFEDDLSVTALVTTADGYAANLQVVTLTWTSGEWVPSSGNYQRTALGLTSTDGKTTISLTDLPTSTASQSCILSGAITFRHYYDVDTIKVNIDNYSASMNVYHFAYSVYVSS